MSGFSIGYEPSFNLWNRSKFGLVGFTNIDYNL
jgi:hypothetical protein